MPKSENKNRSILEEWKESLNRYSFYRWAFSQSFTLLALYLSQEKLEYSLGIMILTSSLLLTLVAGICYGISYSRSYLARGTWLLFLQKYFAGPINIFNNAMTTLCLIIMTVASLFQGDFKTGMISALLCVLSYKHFKFTKQLWKNSKKLLIENRKYRRDAAKSPNP